MINLFLLIVFSIPGFIVYKVSCDFQEKEFLGKSIYKIILKSMVYNGIIFVSTFFIYFGVAELNMRNFNVLSTFSDITYQYLIILIFIIAINMVLSFFIYIIFQKLYWFMLKKIKNMWKKIKTRPKKSK